LAESRSGSQLLSGMRRKNITNMQNLAKIERQKKKTSSSISTGNR